MPPEPSPLKNLDRNLDGLSPGPNPLRSIVVDEAPVEAKLVTSSHAGARHPQDQHSAELPIGSDEPLGKIGRSKPAILTTVFLVAGILGLPLIYYSPVFNQKEKALWTIVVLIYTAILFYILYRVAAWSYESITSAL